MTTSLLNIPLTRIDGSSDTLGGHAGKALLIVNVASKCGLTPQYEGLESLYRDYRARGLEVLGFPANDFNGQEPGTNAEIGDFCRSTFGVEFPMYSKIAVTGPQKHPLYRALIEARPTAEFKPGSTLLERLKRSGGGGDDPEVHWNFEKFLVDRHGSVVRRFAPDTDPRDPAIIAAVEAALQS
ncbi:MAG: glutathione peroxidase [Vicinamibacterales bacterium]